MSAVSTPPFTQREIPGRGQAAPIGAAPGRARAATTAALAVLATLGLAGTSAAHYRGDFAAAAKAAAGAAATPGSQPVHNGMRPLPVADTAGDWLGAFFESLFGIGPPRPPRRLRRPEERRRSPERAPPAALQPPPPPVLGQEENPTVEIPTYRTMCVRLCDGYYWPVSFATTRDYFERDERTCTQSCSSPAALYYYPNPGGVPEDMVSLQDEPYMALDTAFLHRTSYNPACKCHPHPWEPEAAARHKSYADSPPSRALAHGSRAARRR
jgi:hypothetical protein